MVCVCFYFALWALQFHSDEWLRDSRRDCIGGITDDASSFELIEKEGPLAAHQEDHDKDGGEEDGRGNKIYTKRGDGTCVRAKARYGHAVVGCGHIVRIAVETRR